MLPVVPEVMVPPLIVQAYVLPAFNGTLAKRPAWFGSADAGAVMTGADGTALTVMTALPVPLFEPLAFVTVVTEYVVVALGDTLRCTGDELIPLCVSPSDHVSDHGGVPVRSTLNGVVCPLQIVWLPLTVAVGPAAAIGMVLLAAGDVQPARVSVTCSVRLPDAPAVNVIVLPVVAEVMVPPLIVQA